VAPGGLDRPALHSSEGALNTMPSTIYVDARLLFVGGASSPIERLGPDAATSIGHLVEAGHRLVLVGDDDARTTASELGVGWAEAPEEGSGWWLVAARSECGQARSLGFRAMLVGPAVDGGPDANVRCDDEARDLRDATLRILAADAMDGVAPTT
jgi:hypothetical protein